MTDRVDLIIESGDWDEAMLHPICEQAVDLALRFADIDAPGALVTILACDDARIATLNSTYRGKSSATNVLSWPAHDLFPGASGRAPARDIPRDAFGDTVLGDIALARETVVAEAGDAGIPLEHHILHLILHACLHLLGYDHETDADARLMEGVEVKALASIGVASPY